MPHPQRGIWKEHEGELFRLLLENVKDYAIFVIDPEGRVASWNPGAERLLGYRDDEIIGQAITLFFTPEDIAKGFPQREMQQALKEGRGNDDRWHVRKDGSRFWCGGTMTPLWDEGRTLRGFAKVMRDRTEWKWAEEERADRAREAERRQRLYNAVLSNTPDLVYVFGLDHRFTYANEGLLRMWGKTWDEAIGKTCLELGYEPWHAAMHDREIEQVVATKQLVKGEVPFTGTFGRRIYEYIFVPVIGENDEVEAVAGTTRDVTERRQAEEQVREASATLRSFYDTAPVMMGVVEVRGDDILHLTDNAATGRFFGIAPDALAGRAATEIGVPPEHLREWVRHYRESERTGQPARFEYPHETPDGPRWVSAIVYCFERLPGGRSRCSYVAEDVTERKRVEGELREAERRWRDLAEALPNLVWTDLPDGQCDYLSGQWGTYTGIPEQELLGLAWLERVIHPDDREGTLACWMAAVADKGVYDLEYRIRRHDGQYRWFKTRGVPIRDGEGRIVKWFGTCTDIEDEKRAVEALRDADRRKDEFLATLAHELRNPLAPVRNALQILKMPRVDAETVERSRDLMERQVHQLVRLVDDLLDVSRVMRGKIELRRERVELAAVVARAVETVQPLVDAQRHELGVRLPPESLLLDADPVRLCQVVGNLLTNAAKYTEPGGRIRLTAERDGDVAVLRVRDDGIGIAADMLPHVFELFVQADHATTKAQGGLGIGLTLVKNLVALHGGAVEAHSEGLGKGSEFVVKLPVVAQALDRDQSPESGRQADQSPPPSGKRLLVVDDNRDAAESLAMLLRLQGHEVRVAYSGQAALEDAHSFQPDLIFLDIGMPGMDGYEVARRMRQQPGLEDVVLAALTGWGQPEDRRRTAEAGFDHHLVKPPDPKVVEGLVAGLKRSERA
jgi:PAS domain S-box-containing protein